MLTIEDKKQIRKIVKEEVNPKLDEIQDQLETVRGSVITIESKMALLTDI